VNFNRDALPLIRDFQGRLAVVALPCDITKLQAVCEQDGHLAEKIALMISLFCGHNSLPELTQLVVEKMHPPASKLTHFRYRQGHWRGDLLAEFDNGQVISKPFSVFSNYQNLFFFCQQKCHHCHDHCGYHSDISMGDIWSRSMKKNPIKHSAAIIRSERGEEVFKKALETGILTGREVDISAVCQGQSRSMPFHYNLSARALAGKRLGFKIKDTLNETVRWNDWLAARMVLWNEKISRYSCGKRFIRRTPQFILRLYLLVLKGLQSF
jgi:coenzyme F420-reducing hydrogenase beta subunit